MRVSKKGAGCGIVISLFIVAPPEAISDIFLLALRNPSVKGLGFGGILPQT